MWGGVHGDKLFLRLSEDDVANIKNGFKGVTNFEPMPGRAMKGYVILPKSLYTADSIFEEWLDKSIKYVSALPTKKSK